MTALWLCERSFTDKDIAVSYSELHGCQCQVRSRGLEGPFIGSLLDKEVRMMSAYHATNTNIREPAGLCACLEGRDPLRTGWLKVPT